MLRSMFAGLAGLSNNQTALDVIGNNIANVNTVGYKSSKIEFTELLNQTIRGASSPQDSGRGGTNPIQVGLGVGTSAITVSHQQGNLQSTGIMSDLALQGNGFFILGDGSQTFYSRAGSFNFDADGSLVHSSGMKAYGWMADVTGNIDRNTNVQPLSIPVGQTISANPTSAISYAYNLDSRTYTLGTPLLTSGNSANVTTVDGIFTGSPLSTIPPITPLIEDVKGTHTITVNAETHAGIKGGLNGTQTLGSDLGVTNVSSFRVVIDGKVNTINLSNGTTSTVNELMSAINSQLTGVSATLTAGKLLLSRTVAGVGSNIYAYDYNSINNDAFNGLAYGASTVSELEAASIFSYLSTGPEKFIDSSGTVVASNTKIDSVTSPTKLDLTAVPVAVGTKDFSDLESTIKIMLKEALAGHISSSNGIAARVLGGTTSGWLPSAKTVGLNATPKKITDVLAGIDVTNNLEITANGQAAPYTFDPGAAPALSVASTRADLISKFNAWSASLTLGATEVPFYMGLNTDGKLFITYGDNSKTGANTNPLTIADATPDGTGIADLFFYGEDSSGFTDSELAAIQHTKTSTPANIEHTYVPFTLADTFTLPLSFAAGDSMITGMQGVNISTDSNGFKAGSFIIQTVPPQEYVTSTTAYDSLGEERTVTLTFTRIENNSWTYTASGEGAGSGIITFDSLGKIVTGNGNNSTITVANKNGGNPLVIRPNFDAVTQFADTSTLVHASQNGYPNGSLSTYSISSDGVIIGIYSNGLNQNIGQIGVATFNNPTGLLKGSDGMFITSNNSGAPQIGTANSGGRGTISAGTLEMSNVDIAKEFANMIIYQRGFQANSKIITTGDEILQTLVNMKR